MNALLEEFGRGDARTRDEAWRYSKTALRALSQQAFVAADAGAELPDALRDHAAQAPRRLVFVNGVLRPALSTVATGAGVDVHTDASGTRLVLRGEQAQPIHLVFATVAGASAARWSTQLAIDIAGRATLVDDYIGEAGAEALAAVNVSLALAADASLQMTSVCDLADSMSLVRRVDARVAERATLAGTHALAGGRLQRHDLAVDLAGREARHVGRGVFALTRRQHADVHLDVRHLARDTASDLLWRGIADGRARGIFHGAITVAAGADGSDAQLSNKNLLLSAQAEIDTQPVLEIHADEVKAAHGATVGQIDERALFYLRSRGMPLAEARRLLVGAFAAVALDRVPDLALRDRLAARVAPRLAGDEA